MRGELETRTRRRGQGDGGQDMLAGKRFATKEHRKLEEARVDRA
jgi:hypothetical protein